PPPARVGAAGSGGRGRGRGAGRPRAPGGGALPRARGGRPRGPRGREGRAGGPERVITFVAVALLALIAFAYAALPLLSPRHADPLPDDTDPVLAGLEEEKAALLRAIAELDAREDLAAERREQLRRRYEAKAAATIKALDARRAAVAARGRRGTAPAASGTAAPSGAGDASALAGGSPATVGQASAPAGESPAPPGESPAPGGESPAPAGGAAPARPRRAPRSEEHTSELQSREKLVCRLLLEKKNIKPCRDHPH